MCDCIVETHLKLPGVQPHIRQPCRQVCQSTQKTISTHDPRMPPDVRKVNHIRYLMRGRADLGYEVHAAEIAHSAMKSASHNLDAAD